jgi:hypothetical protein
MALAMPEAVPNAILSMHDVGAGTFCDRQRQTRLAN